MRFQSTSEVERALQRLRMLLRRLGSHGGAITPSVYETAQTLRFCPQMVDARLIAGWLLRRQQSDGGWGDPEAPLYRTVPTLAAVLALHEQGDCSASRRACDAGLRFLGGQNEPIDPDCGQYLPVGIELILPRLLDEAAEAGFSLPRARFRHLEELNTRRRALIAHHSPSPNAPPMFSWEAWGERPDPELVGETGGVGHSPAATAWWLRLDGQRRGAATGAARGRALTYLAEASRAAGSGIHGVVPSPWPMNRFEQSFVLHTLVTAGLASRHELASPFLRQAAELNSALKSGGMGFSDSFAPDGDDTAAALGVAAAAGLTADPGILAPFQRSDHFVAYPFELHASHTVTARATQVLAALGHDVTAWRRCVAQGQQPDGWWNSEKWNRSRLYGTHVALASLEPGPTEAKRAAACAFLGYQHNDGGWGSMQQSTPVETAFGLLALCRLAADEDEHNYRNAIAAAHAYLRRNNDLQQNGTQTTWIGKDLFSARRIDQATIQCALLAPHLAAWPARNERRRQKGVSVRASVRGRVKR